MGGMVAQLVALEHGVRSLALIASSPGPGAGCAPPTDAYIEAASELAFTAALDAGDIVAGMAHLLAGHRYPVGTPVSHGSPPATRHAAAVESTPSWHDRLRRLEVPTLIVHGTVDPLFPLDHARLLGDLIAGSEVLELEGMGHEVNDGLAAEIASRLVDHVVAAEG